MVADILWFLFGVVIIFSLFVAVYTQYLLLKDRDAYRKKHNIDPWRHGWDQHNSDNERNGRAEKQD